MIYDQEHQLFYLHTANTSYIFGVAQTGHLLHYYYGPKLDQQFTGKDLLKMPPIDLGSSTNYDDDIGSFNLNHVPLELSTYGKGDYREPMIHLSLDDGFTATDFHYHSHQIIKQHHFEAMPQATKSQTLEVTMKEVNHSLYIKLYYTTYAQSDILVRNAVIDNQTSAVITLERMLSMNLDFKHHQFDLITLDGAWIRERHTHRRPLHYGITKIDSKKGVSSSDHNPFVALMHKDASNLFGPVYGFNLIYSGNFETNIEVNPHDLTRINIGINSFDFRWHLKPQTTFITPEVVMTYAHQGLNKMTQNMHQFIQENIIKNTTTRPIVYNNWEATYFDFNEKKLMAIAKKAKKLGIECFCLDDGWFGKRDNDFSSLGDWHEHPKKHPKGLAYFSEKIRRLGLQFGIWVEPEMVNPDSDLYRKHPEWALHHPTVKPALGRHQLMLDLSNPAVIDYLDDTLTQLFTKTKVSYVKWDMNRNISDLYSQTQPHQSALAHRYVLGLYQLLERLKKQFPTILFESCASGGNRFDLGMLYYMPQIWTSDNTDGYERLKIQMGTALAYPLSAISNHVSGDVSHQVIRHTPLETRFNVASFGLLGYELDLSARPSFDKKTIIPQIAFYKKHRLLFQYGRYYNLSLDDNDVRWLVVSPDKNTAILGLFQGLNTPNPGYQTIHIKGLDETKTYRITQRNQHENLRRFGDLIKHALPIKMNAHGTWFNALANRYLLQVEPFETIQKGNTLMAHGLTYSYRFTGSGHHESMRILPDFSSRMLVIEEINYGNC